MNLTGNRGDCRFVLRDWSSEFFKVGTLLYSPICNLYIHSQAVETAESPINRHPVTGLPVWFNNAHNHARKLRDRRPCGVPEVGMTEVFYADTMEPLSLEDCNEIKRASEKHITALPMEPGDVLLIDNYRALHGRDVFQGDRFHAVSWFTWDGDEKVDWRGNERRMLEKNGLNKAINQMMDWLPKDFESKQN